MAITTHHSRGTQTRTAAVDTTAPREYERAPRVYERPTGAALTGLAAIIVGAWGALAGYVGPYFAFRPVAPHTWVGSWQNGLLHLLPGAVAAAAGLMLLAMGPARRSVRGGALLLPAVLLLAAGAWFVIGPVAWPTFESGPAFNPVLSATRNLLNVACASFAPGLVLVMLGGMALKAGSVRAVPVGDPYTPAEAVVPAERDRLAEREGTGMTERDRLAEREGVGRMAEAEAARPGAGEETTAMERPVSGTDPTVAEGPMTGREASTTDPALRREV
ncbi:MAG TPA: hypothetical protein VFH58_08810 [Acidimicrobiales bacterium]|nr:hypothetical protein [Acidimicrobiales bacterium]